MICAHHSKCVQTSSFLMRWLYLTMHIYPYHICTTYISKKYIAGVVNISLLIERNFTFSANVHKGIQNRYPLIQLNYIPRYFTFYETQKKLHLKFIIIILLAKYRRSLDYFPRLTSKGFLTINISIRPESFPHHFCEDITTSSK